jgi:small-conductance mechanosensitive channel
MAKRKTPKKDKIVDLKPKAKKIETQELNKLQSLVKGINQAQKQIGIIESQKHNMLHDIFEMKNYMMSAQKELEEKYGTHDISLEDGTINYNSNESNETNS